ncbi:hypothetical protein FFLO_05376 [Filobasidium floriforme]|uniref:Cyclin-dependent kinases regulatory subunit n=1 Tax=Filobasidium floriforme TaxID=5210 RepID=A0A8K0JIB4_9TREE|nr:regulatory subunit of cyclin-dependent kinase [Filobasidium floriforme]KAG7529836.1 hypothetical protein FFLO_05376 [Filobasidium floriforme]KAH8079005.1 regulatory subunit of cyclin-dependent kinase [Filobasidium floriforme]
MAHHTFEELAERIVYSDKYADSAFEYRHVILPKQMLKMLPKQYFQDNDTGLLRILSEAEWRGIGITQSLGWEHFEVHAPEPHILLFRREIDYQVKYPQGKPADLAALNRAKAEAAARGNGRA